MALSGSIRRAVGRAAREVSTRPPANARPATYADIVEGRQLTLVLEHPGVRYALRLGDRTVPLAASAIDPADPEAAVLLDLTAATGLPHSWQADLVVDGEPVWVPPSVGDSPVLPPPAPDGQRRFRVTRGRRGVLGVEQLAVPACVPVEGFALVDDGVELRIAGSGEVVLAGDADDLTRVPVTNGPAGSRAVLTVEHPPRGAVEGVALLLDDGVRRLPLGRRANDLARPGGAVVLPTLYDGDRPRLRLRFRQDGTLVGDVPAPE